MVTTLFILAITSLIVNGQNDNGYKTLQGITLPSNLTDHIAAIYGNKLFVFGGRNDTVSILAGYNSKFWSLDLTNKFTLTTDKTDVTYSFSQSEWVELSVTAPSYGDSTNNQFLCLHQCSVVIDQYLYIVGPYSSQTNGGVSPSGQVVNTIYRLDLSQSLPAFAAQTDFPSTLGYTSPARQMCVTSANNVMYTISGAITGSTYSQETIKYDGTTQSSTATTLALGRRNAGCAPNNDESGISLFGGRATGYTYGVYGVDTYTVSSNSWTDMASVQEWGSSTDANSLRSQMRCFKHNYYNKIECPSGVTNVGAISGATASVIWDVYERKKYNATMEYGVYSYGVVNYPVYTGNNEGASVILITGGTLNYGNLQTDITPLIQYAVRYGVITADPTMAPVPSPTMTPSQSPSQSPTCTNCTRSPTSPKDNGSDGMMNYPLISIVMMVLYAVSM